jgi:endogenous inhibitor of DNA gyrase (YacG/DUF329 family)
MLDLGLWVEERYRINQGFILDDAVADTPSPSPSTLTSATSDVS